MDAALDRYQINVVIESVQLAALGALRPRAGYVRLTAKFRLTQPI